MRWRQHGGQVIHYLIRHLFPGCAGCSCASVIQDKRLANDYTKVRAAEMGEVLAETLRAEVGDGQQGSAAQEGHHHCASVGILHPAVFAACPLGGDGEDLPSLEDIHPPADGGHVGFTAPQGDGVPQGEKRPQERAIPGFSLHKAGQGAGLQMGVEYGSIEKVDVVHVDYQRPPGRDSVQLLPIHPAEGEYQAFDDGVYYSFGECRFHGWKSTQERGSSLDK